MSATYNAPIELSVSVLCVRAFCFFTFLRGNEIEHGGWEPAASYCRLIYKHRFFWQTESWFVPSPPSSSLHPMNTK